MADGRIEQNLAKGRQKSARQAGETFSNEEREAMREHVREMKATRRRGNPPDKTELENQVLEKIAQMPSADRVIAERIHAIVMANASSLSPKLWYGMPAYANEDGQVVCFFQNAQKFKTRYATLGFSDKARLDEGSMWATSFAVKGLTASDEARIGALVKRAVG